MILNTGSDCMAIIRVMANWYIIEGPMEIFYSLLLLFLKVLTPFSLTDSIQSFLHWL